MTTKCACKSDRHGHASDACTRKIAFEVTTMVGAILYACEPCGLASIRYADSHPRYRRLAAPARTTEEASR